MSTRSGSLPLRPSPAHAGGPLLPPEQLQALEALLQTMFETPATDVRLLLETAPNSGVRNMAVDEALLESVAAGGPPTFRLYTWSEPTVSVGYFQRRCPELQAGGRFQGLASVRRLSGGGAILHHKELTYSCCLPTVHPLAGEPTRLYDELHRQICTAFAGLGIELAPRGETAGDDKPFLCFARGDRRDLVLKGFKVVGSAQRRRRGAVLQHGSILLQRSPFLPEFPGLLDLARTPLDEGRLRRQLARQCARVLGLNVCEGTLTSDEEALATQFEAGKYSSLDWSAASVVD